MHRNKHQELVLVLRQTVLLDLRVECFEADAQDLRCSVLIPADSFEDTGHMYFFNFAH